MDRSDVIKRIKSDRLVAVVRGESREQGIKVTDAIVAGGIKIIEITMTVPGAVNLIEELSEKYKDTDVIVGAGTVLDPETARTVILAGAQFVVSPMLSIETVKLCNRYKTAVIPGIMTVKEAVEALEMGADILKIFPGNAYSPDIIGAFRGPLPQASFMPTGGVDADNADKWLKAGAVAVGTGSSLTKGAKTGDFDKVTEMAKLFVNKVKEA